MPITVLSPYSGQPVKIRDQDINRAVRDEEGRIFYVLPRSNGKGYYSSLTRQGGEKDEQRYLELEAKTAAVSASVKGGEGVQGAGRAATTQVHDATGRRRGGFRRLIIALLILLAAFAILYVLYGMFATQIDDAIRGLGGEGGPAPAEEAPVEEPSAVEEPVSLLLPGERWVIEIDLRISSVELPSAA